MPRRALAPIILAIFIVSILAFPESIHLVHAQLTGTVCLADPSTASPAAPCPASPAVFDGPLTTPATQLRIGVFIQGSDLLNGFAIIMKADHTVLKPAGVDFTGTVVPGPTTTVVECLSGVLVLGPACNPTADNIDTLDFALAACAGCFTSSPTTGLLFTAIYNITGTTTAATSVGFQADSSCSPSSVAGTPPVCVLVGNGSGTPDSETVQEATFSNSDSATMAFVSVTASPTSFGPEFPGSNVVTITATALNNYPGLATDLVTFTTVASTGLSASLLSPSCMTGGTSCTDSLTLSTTAAGNYSVTVFGTYSTNDPSGNPDTLVGLVRISVIVDDFSITVSPTTISFGAGSSGTATVTLSSLNHFAGSITLSTQTVVPATTPPLTISYSPNPVTLTAGQTLTSTATFSGPTAAATYHAIIKGTSGTRAKSSATLTVTVTAPVPDFSIAASPTSVPVNTGVAGTSTITIGALNGFTGVVTLSSDNTACSLSPTSVTGSGTSTLSCTFASAGTVVVTVTGTSGSLTHTVMITYTVTVPGDFSVSASPTAVTVTVGSPGTSTITISPLSGFTGDVALTSDNSACTLTPSTVTGGSGSSTLSCTFTSAGTVTVTVTCTSGSLTHTASVTYTVTALPDFTLTPTTTTPAFTVLQGSGMDSLTVAATSGFTGTVSFSTTVTSGGSPSAALTASCTSVTLTSTSTTGSSTCTFTSSTAGTYSVVVTGTNSTGSPSHSITYTVTVGKASPTISTTLSSNSIIAGDSVSDSAILAGATTNAGGTVTYAFFASSSCTGTTTIVGSPVVVTNAAVPTSTSQQFSIVGSYSWNALYSGDGNNTGIASTCEPLTVAQGPDFTLTPASSTLIFTVLQGSVADQLTVTAIAGFSDNITFTTSVTSGGVPSTALTASCTSVNLNVASTTSTCTFASSTAGSYSILVTGTGTTSSKSHQTTYTVTVNKATTTISTSLSATTIDAGGSVTDSATLTGATSNAGGTVTYQFFADSSCGGTPTLVGSLVTVTSGVVPSSASQAFPSAGLFSLNAIYSGDANNAPAASSCEPLAVNDFTLAATPTSLGIARYSNQNSTLTIAALGGFSGSVTFSEVVKPTGTTGLTTIVTPVTVSGPWTLTIKVDGTVAPGGYTVNVTATSGSLVHYVIITVTVPSPDIFLSAQPQQVTILLGSSGASTIQATSIDGFTGTITFGATVIPGGSIVTPLPTQSLAPNSLTLGVGGSGSIVLTVNVDRTVAPGIYLVNVTATSGSLQQFIRVFVVIPIPGFTISASTTSETLVAGVSGTSVISLTPLRGFQGAVSLAANSPSSAFTCTASPASVTLGVSGSSNVSCSGTTAGRFNVTITGSGYGQTNSTNVVFTVQDFAISPSATSIVLNTGVNGNVPLDISSVGGYGFEGIVHLTISASAGMNAQLNSSSLHVPGTAGLTLSSDNAGTYTVTITGTNGTLSHSTTLTVNVYASGQVFGLSPTDFYTILGILVIVAIIGSVLALRARRLKQRKSNNRR